MIALIETEGYGVDDYIYVKKEGKGVEGMEVIDSEEKVEQMRKCIYL